MKKEEFFEILGNIDSRYIEKAHRQRKKLVLSWSKGRVAAACLILLVFCVPAAIYFLTKMNNDMLSDRGNIIKVNEVTVTMNAKMDVEITTYDKVTSDVWLSVLEEFRENLGISYEDFQNRIPEEFTCNDFYSLSAPECKEPDYIKEYILHDYVFEYLTESGGKATVAISSLGQPLRDYFVCNNPVKSKINGVAVRIYGYQGSFIVQFQHNSIYYDIETKNVPLDDLEDLLEGIIKEAAI